MSQELIIGLAIGISLGAIGMLGINESWSRLASRQNKEWSEFCEEQNETWAEFWRKHE